MHPNNGRLIKKEFIRMNSLRLKARVNILSITCAVFSSGALAAVESFVYTDAQQKEHNLNIRADSNIFINQNSESTFSVSAGLDRKIRIKHIDVANNKVLIETITPVLNITNKITINGKIFYGALFTINTPRDGQYKIEVDTIDLNDHVVNSETYIYTTDTTPPASVTIDIHNGKQEANNNPLTPSGAIYLGHYSTNQSYIKVTGISDNSSGVESVNLVTFDLRNGKTKNKTVSLNYDKESGAGRLIMYNSTGEQLFSNNNATIPYGLEVHVKDIAGNTYISDMKTVYFDNVGVVDLKLVGVRKPGSTNKIGPYTGYEPYISGGMVYENPISILYTIPQSEYVKNTMGGYYASGATETIDDYDDQYVYVIFTRTFGFKDSNHIRFTDKRAWLAGSVTYNLELSPNAPQTPKRIGEPQLLYSDIGWSRETRWQIQDKELPITISKAKQVVEPQTYRQVFSYRGKKCIIEPNQSECIIDIDDVKMRKGESGYLHSNSTLTSEDGKLVGNPQWSDVTWNSQYPPKITQVKIDDAIMSVSITQPNNGWWFSRLFLDSAWVEEENGNALDIKKQYWNHNETAFETAFDLNELPEGLNKIKVVTQEKHGLKDESDVFSVMADRSPPTITFKYKGDEKIPSEISNIRDIGIDLKDSYTEVSIKSLTLSNQNNESTTLGYSLSEMRENGLEKIYAPELPRLFPTLNEGEKYTLKIEVNDAYMNEAAQSISFRYIPSNLVFMDTQIYLPINVELKTSQDKPIATIRSNTLKLDDGRLATGIQKASATLKQTANYPVMIQGHKIEPGQSIDFDVDLGSSGGELKLPIYPAESEVIGTADILFEIPVLTTQYD